MKCFILFLVMFVTVKGSTVSLDKVNKDKDKVTDKPTFKTVEHVSKTGSEKGTGKGFHMN